MIEARPTFAATLAHHFVATRVEKKLFGGKFVRAGPLLTTGVWLFETGGVLGRQFAQCGAEFIVPFAGSFDLRSIGRDVAKAAPAGGTIFEVFITHAMRVVGAEPSSTTWQEWLVHWANERLPADDAVQMGMFYAIAGAALGYEFADDFEQMYHRTYAESDPDAWREMFAYGTVDSPQQPEYPSFEERAEDAIAEFAEFCRKHYPETLAPLGIDE